MLRTAQLETCECVFVVSPHEQFGLEALTWQFRRGPRNEERHVRIPSSLTVRENARNVDQQTRLPVRSEFGTSEGFVRARAGEVELLACPPQGYGSYERTTGMQINVGLHGRIVSNRLQGKFRLALRTPGPGLV